jgi:N-formylglutamate amidohydrolase
MTDCYQFTTGNSPLLISIPHDGRLLTPGMARLMTGTGLDLPDTDWQVQQLYEFARSLDANILVANYSRYVVDLNRSASDEPLYTGQVATGLFPLQTFDGADIYLAGNEPDLNEQQCRTKTCWEPYHDRIRMELDRIHQQFGYALLWDAHSIRSEVPGLFEGVLPCLNLGTNDGVSCDELLERAVVEAAVESPYSTVLNGRFKGGYITRNYGQPAKGFHAIQLELAQCSYLKKNSREIDEQYLDRLVPTLTNLLAAFTSSADEFLR